MAGLDRPWRSLCALAAELTVAGLAWVAPMLLALAVLAVVRLGSARALRMAAAFVAISSC